MKPFSVGRVLIDPPIVLAPMEGVTDRAFRTLIRELGGCGLAVTEFVSSEAMTRDVRDAWRMAELDPAEHPVSIQIYGRDPDRMAQAARFSEELGADIVDINLGCPSKNVTSGCAGSALMREPERARRIFDAVKAAISVPMTVKMRLGWDEAGLNAATIAKTAEDAGAEMITVHGRTREQMYRGAARWEAVRRVKESVNVPVLVNGDIIDPGTATAALALSGADGVMIGRALMHDPWTIRRIHAWFNHEQFDEPTRDDRRRLLHRYLDKLLVDEEIGRRTGYKLKKTIGYFSKSLPGASRLRQSINEIHDVSDARRVIDSYFDSLAERPDPRFGLVELAGVP